MDYVLVMDHGRLVEQGTPDELAAKNGDYVKLRSEMEASVYETIKRDVCKRHMGDALS